MEHQCMECGKRLLGRIDKKFCNDQCRNTYHNRRNRHDTTYVRQINNILKRNRTVLRLLNPEGKTKVRRQVLEQQGFNFKYYTHTYTTKDQRTYFFSYEYGYVVVGGDYLMIVENKDI